MKPCPDPPKGQVCPLCGGRYICLEWKRPKADTPPTAKNPAATNN